MNERGQFAVCVSIENISSDRVRLVIDDVEREDDDRWRKFSSVTDVQLPYAMVTTMQFTDEQLADFGRLILANVSVLARDR